MFQGLLLSLSFNKNSICMDTYNDHQICLFLSSGVDVEANLGKLGSIQSNWFFSATPPS
jgi:hypothetical protein